RSLSSLCPGSVHSFSTLFPGSVQSLSSLLSSLCPVSVLSLSSFCPVFVQSLSSHCPVIVQSLASLCLVIVQSLSTLPSQNPHFCGGRPPIRKLETSPGFSPSSTLLGVCGGGNLKPGIFRPRNCLRCRSRDHAIPATGNFKGSGEM